MLRFGSLTSLFPLGSATKTTPSMMTCRGSGAGADAEGAEGAAVVGVVVASEAVADRGGATQVAFL